MISAVVKKFFLAPSSSRPLVFLRIFVASLLIAQALVTAKPIFDFYGQGALLHPDISAYLMNSRYLPKLAWILNPLAALGIQETYAILALFLIYVGCLSMVLSGSLIKVAAAMAALLHVIFLNEGYFSEYGIDRFAQICLFYLALMPSEAAFWARRAVLPVTSAATFWRRVLQIHLCIAYLASAVAKGRGQEWWNGEAIWRAWMLPEFRQFDVAWLATVPWVARLAAWGTLIVEGGYAIAMWIPKIRWPWAVATILMHIGIATTMGLWFFSAMMIGLTTCLFLVDANSGD